MPSISNKFSFYQGVSFNYSLLLGNCWPGRCLLFDAAKAEWSWILDQMFDESNRTSVW